MRLRLAFLVAIIATPVLAAEPPATEAPVATASASSSVADQIDAYLRSSPALELEAAEVVGVVPGDDRRPHGEVSVGVGSHGYRSVYARTDLPLGENGRLSIAVENTRFDGGCRHGRPGGRAVGDDLVLGAAAPIERQRCDLQGMTPIRPLDRIGGPNGRCVGSVFDR